MLAYAREELLRSRTKGAKGGEAKWDEVKAMGPASVSMLLTLTLLNRGKSRGSVSPTATSGYVLKKDCILLERGMRKPICRDTMRESAIT